MPNDKCGIKLYPHFVYMHVLLEILMTPLKAEQGHLIKVERVPKKQLNASQVHHVASGPYQGIVINKASGGGRSKLYSSEVDSHSRCNILRLWHK